MLCNCFLTSKNVEYLTVFLSIILSFFVPLRLWNIFFTDLLTIDHHTPTPEKVTYDKTDGQWYGHDGVDIRETQSRKGISQTHYPGNNSKPDVHGNHAL